MLVEGLHGVVQVVLTADGKQNSPPRQIEQGALQSLKSRTGMLGTDLDAGHPIFADNPAPKRVIEIDH